MKTHYNRTIKTFLGNLGYAFLILGFFFINVAKAQSPLPKEMEDVDFTYFVVLGGKCNKLIIDKQDVTQLCRDFFWHMSIKDRLIMVAMLNLKDNNQLQLSFSGSQFQQPRLNRATLFIDHSKLYDDGVVVSELNVVGTCETYGDPTKEVTKHICVAQVVDGGEIIFEFSSYPNQVEIFN